MKKPTSYYYVASEPPDGPLSKDTWGVKYLYVDDDKDNAISFARNYNQNQRPKGAPKYKVFRVKFAELL